MSQIKRAIQELESGNASAFATGKAARQKEKEVLLLDACLSCTTAVLQVDGCPASSGRPSATLGPTRLDI